MSEQVKFEGSIFGYDTLIRSEEDFISLRGERVPELRKGMKVILSGDIKGYIASHFNAAEKVTIVGFREPHKEGNSDNILCVSNGQSEGWIKTSNIRRVLRHQVFVSYSHKDKKWLERLQVHLQPLEKSGVAIWWDDTLIKPGSKWREDITKALNSTKVAVLLISADFLASDFIVDNELPPLLTAANEDGAVILPVIISHCLFEQTPSLSQFKAVNSPAHPLGSLSKARRELEFVNLVRVIESSLRD